MEVKSASANIASKFIRMYVVLFKVTHAEAKREVSIFAMLGKGCFIKSNIRERLGAKGRKT